MALSPSKSLKRNSKAPKERKTVTQQTINNNRFRDTLLPWPNDQMDVGRPHKIHSVARVIYSTFIRHYRQTDACSWYLVTVLFSSVLSPLRWQKPFGKRLWFVFSCPTEWDVLPSRWKHTKQCSYVTLESELLLLCQSPCRRTEYKVLLSFCVASVWYICHTFFFSCGRFISSKRSLWGTAHETEVKTVHCFPVRSGKKKKNLLPFLQSVFSHYSFR